jgi:hypothetical protein
MKLIANGTEVDAAALFCGLYNTAKPYEPDQPQMTMQQAQGLLAGNGMHCDFDRVFGRAICMSVDPASNRVRRTDLYEAVNGAGTFEVALVLALELETETAKEKSVEALAEEA